MKRPHKPSKSLTPAQISAAEYRDLSWRYYSMGGSLAFAQKGLDADHPMLTPQGRAAAIALDEAINELRRIIRTERLDPETGEIIYATKTEEELN